MKKLLIATSLALSLAVSGCAENLQNFKDTVQQVVSPDNFDTVTALYGSTLAVAVSYRRLCERKIINKSCWTVIARLQPYENRAYNSYKTLQEFVRSNPTLDASTLIKLTKDAITAFQNEQYINGVGK